MPAVKSELDVFQNIGSPKLNERIHSGCRLVQIMLYKRETVMKKWLFRRLVRGLGSVKESTRSGYFSALVAVLAATPLSILDFESYNQIVEAELQKTTAKLDEGLTLLGKILALGALVQSGYFEELGQTEQEQVVDSLLKHMRGKAYLGYPAVAFIVRILQKIDKSTFKTILMPKLERLLEKNCLQIHDKLFILMTVEQTFGSKFVKRLQGLNLFNDRSVPTLVSEFMENSPNVEYLKHPVLQLMHEYLISNMSSSELFWTSLDAYLANKKVLTYNQELMALTSINIFSTILQPCYITRVPLIFQPHILSLVLQTGVKHKNVTHPMLANLTQQLSKDSKVSFEVLQSILGDQKGLNFDEATNTTFVHQLSSNLRLDEIKALTEIYKSILLGKKGVQGNSNWTNKEKLTAANRIGKLLSTPVLQEDSTWKVRSIKPLVCMGIFKTEKYPCSQDLSLLLREIFFKVVTVKHTTIQNYISVLNGTTNLIQKEIQKGTQLRLKWSDETVSKFSQGLAKAQELGDNDDWNVKTFKLMILYSTILMIKEPKTAEETLDELYAVIERVKNPKKIKKNEPHWSEVLVDLFLHLLSKSCSSHRNLIGCVFKFITPHLNKTTIEQITSILDLTQSIDQAEDDSEKEEAVSEGDEEESSSSEEESDIDDDIDEDPSQTEQLRMALSTALKESGFSDDESVDLDNMTEEEGAKLDAVLQSVFKSQMGQQKTKAKKKQSLESHFRIRVLDLIEILYANKLPLSLVLDTFPPMLKLLEFSIKTKGHNQVQCKIRKCLHKLTVPLELNEVTSERLAETLNTVLDKGEIVTPVYKEMIPELVQITKYLLKCSLQFYNTFNKTELKDNKMFTAIKGHFEGYFKRKDSNLTFNFLKSLIHSEWPGLYPVMAKLSKWAFSNEITPYKQTQAVELLEEFLFRTRCLKDNNQGSKSYVEKIFTEISKGSIEYLSQNPDTDAHAKYIDKLFRFLYQLHKIKGCKLNMHWEGIKATLESWSSARTTYDNQWKNSYKTLAKELGIKIQEKDQLQVTKKANKDKEKGVEKAKEEKKPQKRKINSKQLKKMSKKLRLAVMEEGLERSTFNENTLDSE